MGTALGFVKIRVNGGGHVTCRDLNAGMELKGGPNQGGRFYIIAYSVRLPKSFLK
jgi:hypothetical protein